MQSPFKSLEDLTSSDDVVVPADILECDVDEETGS